MNSITKTVVALAATAEICLAFHGQPFGINPGGTNYFPDDRQWPSNILPLWQGLTPGPEEVYAWIDGHINPPGWGYGFSVNLETIYLAIDDPNWVFFWVYDGKTRLYFVDSLVNDARVLKEHGREPVIWSHLYGMGMPKFMPWSSQVPSSLMYVSSCPFGWDEAYPEEDYPGCCAIPNIRVYTKTNTDDDPEYYLAEFTDDDLDTVFHWALAEYALGEGLTSGWAPDPTLHPQAYERYMSGLSDLGQRLEKTNADDYIDYVIVSAPPVPWWCYWKVFCWDPPLEMGDQHEYPDSIVLCGKGGLVNLGDGKTPYPSPIEDPTAPWAIDNMHYGGPDPVDPPGKSVRFWTRIVLLKDPRNTEGGDPSLESDRSAKVAVHLYALDNSEGAWETGVPSEIEPSVSCTFDLMVSEEFRRWVISSSNPNWAYESYLKPYLDTLSKYMPDAKLIINLGEQNFKDHKILWIEPEDRWAKCYEWLTDEDRYRERYPGGFGGRDSMRSHRLPPPYDNVPTGMLDGASKLLLGPHTTEILSLIDGISFNLYICHWAPDGYEGIVNQDLVNPYERIGPDMEEIAAFNDSLGGKEILVREIILPLPGKRWEDKESISHVFKENLPYPGPALDSPWLLGYRSLARK